MPGKVRRNSPAIFIGNLRTDIRISLLKDNICSLFTVINIDHIRKKHIVVVNRPYATFSFVTVRTDEEAKYAVSKFTELLHHNAISEDLLDSLVEQGLYLKVGLRTDFAEKSASDDKSHVESVHVDSNDEISFDKEFSTSHSSRVIGPVKDDQYSCSSQVSRLNQEVVSSDEVAPPSRLLGDHKGGPLAAVRTNHTIPGGAYSDSSLLPKANGGVSLKPQVKKYVLGQKLGNETRNVEYKCGQGNYKDKHFFRHVAVYMSAFLNSNGGTLLIGVDDDGVVQGLRLSHKEEDSLRTKIDITIKDIRPEVFPAAYSVHFVPVFDNIGKILKELKVIELWIRRGESSQLYQTGRGEVYIRRDGSVQELSASAIQEYTRIRVLQELEKKGHEMKNLEQQDVELKQQFVLLQQQLGDIRLQMSEAENQRLQSLRTEAERDQLQQEVGRLGRRLEELSREKSAERVERGRLSGELESLRRERQEWQEKGLRRNKSKTCVLM